MKSILILLALMAVPFASSGALSASAQSWAPGQARDAVRKGDIIPLREIFANLRRRYGGYQASAELFSRPGGGSDYHIEWVTGDGRKLRLVVNAQTGRITRSSGD